MFWNIFLNINLPINQLFFILIFNFSFFNEFVRRYLQILQMSSLQKKFQKIHRKCELTMRDYRNSKRLLIFDDLKKNSSLFYNFKKSVLWTILLTVHHVKSCDKKISVNRNFLHCCYSAKYVLTATFLSLDLFQNFNHFTFLPYSKYVFNYFLKLFTFLVILQ